MFRFTAPLLPALTRRRAAGVVAFLAPLVIGVACGEITDPARPDVLAPLGNVSAAEACGGFTDVPAGGVYCGVNVIISPYSTNTAPWGGATFQSTPGSGVSSTITITFSDPVASVEVTAYDPTWQGNMIEAYGANGALVGSASVPGNETPGTLTIHTRTFVGQITMMKLIPAPGEYINYSMRVAFQDKSIEILEAKGPNEGSFLGKIPRGFSGAGGDDLIKLLAKTGDPAMESLVKWEVKDYEGDLVQTPIPDDVPDGLESEFTVPAPSASRWSAPHPYALTRTALAYEIRATIPDPFAADGLKKSEPRYASQDAKDAQRQEYIDLSVPQRMIPARGDLAPHKYYDRPDYPHAVVNKGFDELFAKLEAAWKPMQWQVNGLYRSPGHNAYHVPGGSSSGTVSGSWHQYGCGADIQTFPVLTPTSTPEDRVEANDFWDALAAEAKALGFTVERKTGPKPFSGVGHVHVELKCRK